MSDIFYYHKKKLCKKGLNQDHEIIMCTDSIMFFYRGSHSLPAPHPSMTIQHGALLLSTSTSRMELSEPQMNSELQLKGPELNLMAESLLPQV